MKIPDAICELCVGRVKYFPEKYEPGDWYCLNDECRAWYNDRGEMMSVKHGLRSYWEEDGTMVTL